MQGRGAVLIKPAEPLASWTTLRLGGPARELEVTRDRQSLYDAVAELDARGIPAMVLGGGSNLVVADVGYDGTVVVTRSHGLAVSADRCGGAEVTVEAGVSWDELVAQAISEEWIGIEAMSGIPGSVGAVPIQNVGAYGQEVAETIARVQVYDRIDRQPRTFAAADCGFTYRSSRFKLDSTRYVVGAVIFQFKLGSLGAPVKYAELARSLGVEVGARVPSADVREAVLSLRRGKGMVLDEADHDTWSAGSFFTNPFLSADQLPDGAPAYPQDDGTVKTSAAWLIEQAGFKKGYGNDRVSLSTKHTLALTNRGGASTADLLALAAEVRDGVGEKFGITLATEPVLVNCAF